MDKIVLLVEDNVDTRRIYATILRHRGYSVIEAADGEAGVRLAGESIPHAILMDVSLPILDGWQSTALIKQDPGTASIPVIILTAHAGEQERKRAESLRCAGFLTKPCNPSQVVAELDRVLATSAVPAD